MSALLPLQSTQQFSGAVSNDPNNKGVSWTLSQNGAACASPCGSLDQTNTASGSPTTYTAPANLPNNSAVTLTADSMSNASNTAAASITLTTGTVKVVPFSVDFGRVLEKQTSSAQVVTLTNMGTSALSITSIAVTGANASDYSQQSTCGASVGVGISCTISVTFTPTSTGTRTASIFISDSSTDSPQQISLKGTGFTANDQVVAAVRPTLRSTKTVAVPGPTGPYSVGTRTMHLTDSTRNDPFLADGTKRELTVRFWYPASLNQECSPAEYTSTAVWDYFSHLANVQPFKVTTNSCLNAPITDGSHPAVVFTPGYTATFTDYTFLFEDLASRGYVIASVDHTYEATAVELSNGTLAKSVLGSHLANTWHGDEKTFSFATYVRLQDLEFVLNELGRLNSQPGSPFSGQIDMSKLAIAGHSMGGVTAFLGAKLDSRFKATVMLDASMPQSLVSSMKTPVLIATAGRNQWDPSECRLWVNLEGPRLAVNFQGSEHVTFSDWIWLAKSSIQTGPMGPEKTMSAVRDYVAAFLDANLRNELPSPLLHGPSFDYPDVAVTASDQSLCRQP